MQKIRENNKKKVKRVLLGFLFVLLMVMGTVSVSASSNHRVTVRFRDSAGNPISGIQDKVLYENSKISLPEAPRMTNSTVVGSSSWKTTFQVTGDTQYFENGQTLSYDVARDWIAEQGTGNVLTLYGTKVCTFRYYNNTGSERIGGDFRAYEGTEITFRKSPDSKNKLYRGWSKYKKGTGVWAGFGKPYVMDQDRNLYLVEYARVRFYDANGSTGSVYQKMEKIVKKGTKLVLPPVPEASNYRNMGWSTSKNASSAVYGSKESITVQNSMTLYAARKYLPYSVTFNNNTGTSKEKAFRDLYVRAGKNESIKLPKVPAQKGYTALGWATRTKRTKEEYKEGQQVRITKKTKFYAVYRSAKKYTVSFAMGNGSSPSSYAALKRTVAEKSTITLPAVPSRTGYINDGWVLKTKSQTRYYKEGEKVKIYGNCKFQAVQKQAASVVLHKTRGAAYKTVYLPKGNSYTLPSAENPEGYTFMGWSTKPNVVVTGSNPVKAQYEAGEVLPSVTSTVHLYQVMYQRSSEKNIISSQMARPDLNRYSSVIMVGDSRTVRMRQTLESQNCGANMSGARFVAASGQGLKWFETEGYTLLKNQIRHVNPTSSKPAAIVFNLGINDLSRISEYIAYMNQIAPELQAMHCKLFYMSLNPINSVMIEKTGRLSRRTEAGTRDFNSRLKTGLSGNYTYIDSYSWLMKTGFGTCNGKNGKDSSEDDGLHYTVKTYKRIYDFCLRYVNTH